MTSLHALQTISRRKHTEQNSKDLTHLSSITTHLQKTQSAGGMGVRSALLLVALVSVFRGGICGPSGHLVSSLPGQPENVTFAQYAGYITVDAEAGRQFFYYFAEAESDPSSKPLTLWLNGGPGCSSVGNGAFTENGPFRVSAESGKLIANEFSWNKVSNMLFLDSPAGVGWSYSNRSSDLVTNDNSTAWDNFVFLKNWFEAFPEYKGREFYITGESYAGHYAPQLAALIVDYMAESGTSIINLVSMAIGNPLLDGLVDFPEEVFFQWTHGLISDSTYNSIISNCEFSYTALRSKECHTALQEAERETSDYIDAYDVLIDVCLSPSTLQARKLKRFMRSATLRSSSSPLDVCIDDEVVGYMNIPAVQEAFHANNTGLPYRWYYCNEGSLQYDESAIDDSMLPTLSHILTGGVSILVYSGDADSVIPFGGSRKLVGQLAAMNNLNTSVPYSAWFDGGQVGGWTQVYGSLSYVTIRGASHMVPYSSPGRALIVFERFLAGESVPLKAPPSQIRMVVQ